MVIEDLLGIPSGVRQHAPGDRAAQTEIRVLIGKHMRASVLDSSRPMAGGVSPSPSGGRLGGEREPFPRRPSSMQTKGRQA